MALVKLLLDRGANTDTMDDFQNTPLKLAQETGIRKWLKFFQTPRAWRQQFRRILRIDTKRLIPKICKRLRICPWIGSNFSQLYFLRDEKVLSISMRTYGCKLFRK